VDTLPQSAAPSLTAAIGWPLANRNAVMTGVVVTKPACGYVLFVPGVGTVTVIRISSGFDVLATITSSNSTP